MSQPYLRSELLEPLLGRRGQIVGIGSGGPCWPCRPGSLAPMLGRYGGTVCAGCCGSGLLSRPPFRLRQDQQKKSLPSKRNLELLSILK
jgi:hypothetical protein